MIRIDFDADKIVDTLSTIKSYEYAVKTSAHINEVVKCANILITSEFVKHMTAAAVAEPKKFQHMYEWNSVGDPNQRLWKHVLRGAGGTRQLTFDFKASKTIVPVAPALAEVGVKRIHTFVWKAAVMELGLPVRISPKLAKMLVFEAKDVKNGATSSGSGFERGNLVYYDGTISIPHQGSSQMWHSFTTEFMTWMNSERPREILASMLTPKFLETTKKTLRDRFRAISIRNRNKTFTLKPVGIDQAFVAKINNSLRVNYIAMAANRRVMTDE